jgi:hypothetical protein
MSEVQAGQNVVVEAKSAWISKINWTQAISMVAMVATYFGINMPADVQAAILAAIVAVSTVVTWILRTWFSPTVTPASVGK